MDDESGMFPVDLYIDEESDDGNYELRQSSVIDAFFFLGNSVITMGWVCEFIVGSLVQMVYKSEGGV